MLLGIPNLELICIDLSSFGFKFPCSPPQGGVPFTPSRSSFQRRLIPLIFVGWVPPDLSSSCSCLALLSRVVQAEAQTPPSSIEDSANLAAFGSA